MPVFVPVVGKCATFPTVKGGTLNGRVNCEDLTMAGGSTYWRVPLTASASPHRCAQPQGATSDSSSALVAYPYEHIIWGCNEQDPPSSREGLS